MNKPAFIPRPLVRTNQWTIVIAVVLAWVLQTPWLLAIPLAAGLMGLAFGWNPSMRFARLFLRKKPAEYTPEDPVQQRFNQMIAVSCLALSLVGYALGWTVMGYVFSAVVGLAAFIAILGFCVGCYIHFQWSQYRYRRASRS